MNNTKEKGDPILGVFEMVSQAWVCPVCNGHYWLKEDAERCESIHLKVEDLKIRGLEFSPSTKKVPKKVVIQWGKDRGEFASYTLEHIGFKGV